MSTYSTVIMESDHGLDLMTEALRDHLSGQTRKQPVFGSGLRNNQATGKTKTVFTLWVPIMATLGTTFPAITAITILVFEVKAVIRSVLQLTLNDLLVGT